MSSTKNFSSGYREIGYRFELLNRLRDPIADITDQVVEAEVSHNAFTTIKRTAKFKIKEKTGTAPATLLSDYSNSWWHPDIPWKDWSGTTQDIEKRYGKLMHPVYKVYSGDYNEFNSENVINRPDNAEFPWVGTHSEGWDFWATYTRSMGDPRKTYIDRVTSVKSPTNFYQSIQSSQFTGGDWCFAETQSNMSTADKRVHFTGFFRSDYSDTFPEVFIRYSGNGTQTVQKIPTANMTTAPIQNTGTDGMGVWRYFEGYVDVTPVNGHTLCRIGVGVSGSGSAFKTHHYASFYYDAAKASNFKLVATSESTVINSSVDDVLNLPNKFRASLTTSEYGVTNIPHDSGLIVPTNKLEIRFSTNGGSTWSSYYPFDNWKSNLAENTDIRNMRVQFKYSCTAYSQFMLPSLNNWRLAIGAQTNIKNRNTDGIDYIKNYIKPYLQINESGTWQEYPLGVFLMSSPKRADEEGGVTREVDAYDILTILDQTKLTYPITVFPHATNGWGQTVRELLKGTYSSGTAFWFGRTFLDADMNIPNTNPVPNSRGRNFPIGESLLTVCNELLGAGNCISLYCNSQGIITSETYILPQDKPVAFNYLDNEMSIIFTQADEEIDTFNTANVFVSVQQATPDGEQLVSRYFNFNDGHPSSINTQGRYIVDYREPENVETQEELDNYVRRTAYEASQAYGQIHFNTALDPGHEHMQNIYLRYQDLQIDGNFTETAWTMHLTDDPYMEHRLRRIATI